MIDAYIYAIVSVLIVSAISLVGVFTFSIREEFTRKYIFIFVSLAVGALLGDAFIHIIPETFEKIGNPTTASIVVIGGILIFFILEKILHWHHHHDEGVHSDDVHPVGKMVLISDGMHNLIDGLIIGASYLVSVEIGIATTIAVILHEIPQEIGDFGILLHSGYTKARALRLNFLSALLAVLGTIIAIVLGGVSDNLMIYLAAVAGGGFIYIAMSDLIPELHRTKKVSHTLLQLAALVVGILSMIALLGLE